MYMKISSMITTKILAIFLLLISALIGGLLPIKWKRFRDSARTISFANSFAAGLFLGVGLFHILPEAVEDYTNSQGAAYNSNGFPIIFFITTCSYTFILFLDRVVLYEDHDAFHNHGGHEHSEHEHEHGVSSARDNAFGPQIDENHEEATFLEKKQSARGERNLDGKKDSKLGVSRQLSIKEANFSPAVIFVALTLHALFEGIAVGLEDTENGTVNLLIAILIHKWAEALALGARLVKSRTDRVVVYSLIGGFCCSTPVGIIIGLSLLNAPLIWSAIFKAISAGTFVYLSATEIAVEEFGVKKDRYWKFAFYTLGLALITVATALE